MHEKEARHDRIGLLHIHFMEKSEKTLQWGYFWQYFTHKGKIQQKIFVYSTANCYFCNEFQKKAPYHWHKSVWVKPAWRLPYFRKHHPPFIQAVVHHRFHYMKKYQRPVTEIESIMLEGSILQESFASSDDMVMYDGLPTRGDSQLDPVFNSNKFNSEGYWWHHQNQTEKDYNRTQAYRQATHSYP